MSAAIAIKPAVSSSSLRTPKNRTLTFEGFLKKYSSVEDGYKYEWNNGVVEKYPKMLTKEQLHILRNLNRFFSTTESYTNGGEFVQEFVTMTTKTQMRLPDICYLSAKDNLDCDRGAYVITPFAIEVVSTNDKVNELNAKTREYFNAGVKVVWHIFPEIEMVAVYTAPLAVKLCEGETLCSAETVIPGFIIQAQNIFRKL